MATALTVRGLDEELIRRLKLRAARHGRSMEAECREIIRQALAGEPQDFRALAASLRQNLANRAHTTAAALAVDDHTDEPSPALTES